LGLNFGEPSEIGSAKEQLEKGINENLTQIKEGIEKGQISSVEVQGKTIKITLENGTTYNISVREVIKNE